MADHNAAARYFALVVFVLLGVFVFIGWRVKDQMNPSGEQPPLLQDQHRELLQANTDEPAPVVLEFDEEPAEDATLGDLPDPLSDNPLVDPPADLPDASAIEADADPLDDITLEETTESEPLGVEQPVDVAEPAEDVTAERPPLLDAPIESLKPLEDPVQKPTMVDEPPAAPEQAAITIDEDPAVETIGGNAPTVTVKRGDTLSRIARRELGSATRWREIFKANRDMLEAPDKLRVGMVLRLPVDARGASVPAPDPTRRVHVVSTRDERLANIAIRYYGSPSPAHLDRIRQANPHLRGDALRPGMELVVPGDAAATPSPASTDARTHVVQRGDSLSRIAREKLGSVSRWREIYTLNRDQLDSPHALQVGMKLKLPSR